jgi:hypothetical protein
LLREQPLFSGLKLSPARVALALSAAFALASCTTGGARVADSTALEEVRNASLASVPEGAGTMDPSLMEGSVMNVATAGSTETAFIPDPVPDAPDMASDRDAAVAQIRAKAASMEDEKPNVFDRGTSSVRPLTSAEQEQLKAELATIAARNRNAISAGEAERRAEEIRRLRQRAQSHYDDTIELIE